MVEASAHNRWAYHDHCVSLVCDGAVSLATAQRAIAINWWIAYQTCAPAPAPTPPLRPHRPLHRHPHPRVRRSKGFHPGGDTWKLVHRHVGPISTPDPDGPLRGSGE
ncbi:MAG TPA: hypothetical protein VIM49_14675 [Dermatophilaceae bacterium]